MEACINSRPLTTVGDSKDSLTPLTPSHFLIGRSNQFQPEVDLSIQEPVKPLDLNMRDKHRQQLLDKFWAVWSQDYLRNLPPALNRFKKSGDLKLGSVVLIKEDNHARMLWPIGVVTEMHPGRDGVVRSVSLKTAKGIVTRSIQWLYDLEISENDPLPSTPLPLAEADKTSDVYTTRSGRMVKARKILGT